MPLVSHVCYNILHIGLAILLATCQRNNTNHTPLNLKYWTDDPIRNVCIMFSIDATCYLLKTTHIQHDLSTQSTGPSKKPENMFLVNRLCVGLEYRPCNNVGNLRGKQDKTIYTPPTEIEVAIKDLYVMISQSMSRPFDYSVCICPSLIYITDI